MFSFALSEKWQGKQKLHRTDKENCIFFRGCLALHNKSSL